ncbi:hypothetical protein I0D68_02370 [Pseudomonas lalucatii]|nr:hypothetical protein [Pseudomonas lalucatii]QVM87872.1 hypothetical protein I0D68_02370 [Pseudomonas lalucatii]
MFTHWLKIYSVPLAIGIAGAGLFAGPASAGTCELADANRDTGWLLTFDDAQVSNCVFTGNAGTGRNKGTLDLTLNVANAKPIDIGFVQAVAAAEDSFGLRITWNLSLNNNYQLLRGIRGRAFDNTEKLDDDENEFVENAHRASPTSTTMAPSTQDPSSGPRIATANRTATSRSRARMPGASRSARRVPSRA